MLAPEALLPLSPPWLSNLYTDHQHTFNALCARRTDPAWPAVIRLYSVSPRATQFALSALPAPRALMHRECWACRDPGMSDNVLWHSAHAAQQYSALIYGQAVQKGWKLPHFLFMHARLLQASGDVEEALTVYRQAEGSTWAAAFEAMREVHRLHDNRTLVFLRRSGRLALNASSAAATRDSKKELQAAEYALQLGWLHQRPGSGAAFGQSHACSGKAWFRAAARAGLAVGALYAGLSAHYGHCSGTLTAQGLREAAQWYRRARLLAVPGDPTALIAMAAGALAAAAEAT